MAPSWGWIIHSLEATPAILTEEDITTASSGKITEFYQGVKTLMLLRLAVLLQDLREDLISHPALDFYGILYTAVDLGMYRGGPMQSLKSVSACAGIPGSYASR